ncbi:MAG: DASH family cryptochrome [Bacteroidota bacterium]
MKKKRVIVWFREDLRLHDNEALTEALRTAEEVIPVFVFDERVFQGQTKFGFQKTGPHRAKFLIESIQDLRSSLKALGTNLVVRVGKPEAEIFQLANQIKSTWVFCNRERTAEEVAVQDNLEKKLWEVGQEVRYSRGKMLYYTADLPFPVTHTPDIFTHFRKEVEKFVQIREPLAAPEKGDFQPWTTRIELGDIPTLADFGLTEVEKDERAVLDFKGGESEGLKRLNYYLWESDLITNYKETRNGLIGGDYSSKFSVWLAHGCLSPKMIYHELKKYEAERKKNRSTYWLFFELMWRDFFRLMGKKHGNAIFQKGGTNGEIDDTWENNYQLLQVWKEGRTGIPFIDANMREIAQTGFMSNRGRQNVASFLVKDLHVNWQMGAEYFESMLIDYDPCSNWGNWNYVAGVGSDPKENRYFNILKQAQRYDAKGEYVKIWCPELSEVPAEKIHRPDTLSESEQKSYGVKLGFNYPKAMVNTAKWV